MPSNTAQVQAELKVRCEAGELWACNQAQFLTSRETDTTQQNLKPPQGFSEGGPVTREIDTSRPVLESKMAPGKKATEESITVQVGDAWVNLPTIVEGKRVSEKDAISLMLEGKNKNTGVFDTEEDAVKDAIQRSKDIGTVRKFSDGGAVDGVGTSTSDSIPANLSDGEFVVTAKAVQQIGVENLQAMMDKAEQEANAAANPTGIKQQMQQIFTRVK